MEKPKIIENLTKEEAIRLHREMWDFIDKKTKELECDSRELRNNLKKEFLNGIGLEVYEIKNGCFLCEYSEQQSVKYLETSFCKFCPLDWCDGCDRKLFCNKSFACECGEICALGDKATYQMNWQYSDCKTIRDLKEKD